MIEARGLTTVAGPCPTDHATTVQSEPVTLARAIRSERVKFRSLRSTLAAAVVSEVACTDYNLGCTTYPAAARRAPGNEL